MKTYDKEVIIFLKKIRHISICEARRYYKSGNKKKKKNQPKARSLNKQKHQQARTKCSRLNAPIRFVHHCVQLNATRHQVRMLTPVPQPSFHSQSYDRIGHQLLLLDFSRPYTNKHHHLVSHVYTHTETLFSFFT